MERRNPEPIGEPIRETRSAQEGPVALRQYLEVLAARKWTVAFVATVITAVVLAYSLQQTPLYQSEAEVFVEQPGATQLQLNMPPNLDTEKELAESEAVAAIVAKRTGVPATTVREGLTVSLTANTEILVFKYVHRTPGLARRYANAFVDAYLDFRRREVVDDLLAASASVQDRIQKLSDELARINRHIEGSTNDDEVIALQSQASSLTGQIAVLQQELADLSPPENLQVGQVVGQADQPTRPISPDHRRNGILGLSLGLAIGIVLAFFREHLDDSLRGKDDLESLAGAPVLAAVPRIAHWKRRDKPLLITLSDPASATSEAYRKLRTSLLFITSQTGAKVLMVTSSQADEGKTATTANVGVVMAQAGKKVVVVSADLRKPRLHRFFGIENHIGATNVLAGEVSPWQAVRDTHTPNLQLLPSGSVPANPAELLGSDAMGRLLAALSQVADYVIVDAAPVMAVADPVTLTPLVDGVLFVADAQKARRGTIEQARRQLSQVNAHIIGAVLNNFDPAKAGGYYYAPSYRYEEARDSSEAETEERRRLPWRTGVK
jgi:polysaccharide biosynthesis transport protein